MAALVEQLRLSQQRLQVAQADYFETLIRAAATTMPSNTRPNWANLEARRRDFHQRLAQFVGQASMIIRRVYAE